MMIDRGRSSRDASQLSDQIDEIMDTYDIDDNKVVATQKTTNLLLKQKTQTQERDYASGKAEVPKISATQKTTNVLLKKKAQIQEREYDSDDSDYEDKDKVPKISSKTRKKTPRSLPLHESAQLFQRQLQESEILRNKLQADSAKQIANDIKEESIKQIINIVSEVFQNFLIKTLNLDSKEIIKFLHPLELKPAIMTFLNKYYSPLFDESFFIYNSNNEHFNDDIIKFMQVFIPLHIYTNNEVLSAIHSIEHYIYDFYGADKYETRIDLILRKKE